MAGCGSCGGGAVPASGIGQRVASADGAGVQGTDPPTFGVKLPDGTVEEVGDSYIEAMALTRKTGGQLITLGAPVDGSA